MQDSTKKLLTTRNIAKIAILSAIAFILMLIEFPLPFAPSFYKMDFSEVAVLMGGFAMGPWAAVVIEALKIVLHLLFKGTITMGVGELANFLIGCALCMPAAWIYKKHKSRSSAIKGMAVGTLCMAAFTEKIRNEFAYLSYAPIIFVSAKTHQRVDTIVPMVDKVFENSTRRIPTNILNQVIADSQVTNPAPARNGKRFRIYYVTQVTNQPPTFVLSCNDPKLMHFSYQRFIENTLRSAFDFEGTPIHIIARKKVTE